MDAPKGEWRKSTDRFVSGHGYWLGRVKVGVTFYDGVSSRAETRRHKSELLLPGVSLKADKDRAETEGEAMEIVERGVAAWFQMLESPRPA